MLAGGTYIPVEEGYMYTMYNICCRSLLDGFALGLKLVYYLCNELAKFLAG